MSDAAPDASRPATPEDVDAICASLPETELGISWGDRPTWKVPPGGKGFLLYRAPHHSALDPQSGQPYDDLLVIWVPDQATKTALVEGDGPFFTIEHFRRTDAVLVQQSRLGEISLAELTEVITDAWLRMAPKRLARGFLADG